MCRSYWDHIVTDGILVVPQARLCYSHFVLSSLAVTGIVQMNIKVKALTYSHSTRSKRATVFTPMAYCVFENCNECSI